MAAWSCTVGPNSQKLGDLVAPCFYSSWYKQDYPLSLLRAGKSYFWWPPRQPKSRRPSMAAAGSSPRFQPVGTKAIRVGHINVSQHRRDIFPCWCQKQLCRRYRATISIHVRLVHRCGRGGQLYPTAQASPAPLCSRDRGVCEACTHWLFSGSLRRYGRSIVAQSKRGPCNRRLLLRQGQPPFRD